MKRVALLLLACLAGCSVEERTLSIAHSVEEPAGTMAASMAVSLKNAGITLSIVESRNPAELLTAVLDGDIDLAIVEEPDEPIPGLITIAPLYPSVLHVLHRRENMDGTLSALLTGASVYPGPVGSAGYRLLKKLAEDHAIRALDYTLLDNPWTTTPDVFFIFGGLLPRENYVSLSDYSLFSFQTAEDVAGSALADGISLRHHHVRPFMIPKGVYPSLSPEPVLTLSTRTVLVANRTLDPELAYDVAKILFGSAQELSRSYPLVTRELTENIDTSALMLPLHDGTRRYLDRDGPGYIERHVDVIALYLTIFLTLGSGIIAYLRHRKQTRKDRVDIYYQQLLEIRKDMRNADAASLRPRILDVQQEVLELLVDERIAADNSLLGFISLSNQMLSELSAKERNNI